MKTSGIRNFFKNRVALSFMSAVFLFLSLPVAQATPYYWDTNGTTAGAGATPGGTWTTAADWNTDSTGAAGGTFGTVPTSTDTANFVAGAGAGSGSSNYIVGLGGATVTVSGLTIGATGTTTIGSSVGDGTITIGTTGINILNNITGANTSAPVTISSNIALGGNQTWTTSVGLAGSGFTVAGAIGGTGNLNLVTNNRGATLAGSVNNSGTLTVGVTGANSGLTITGNIGSNVTDIGTNAGGIFILSGTNSYTGNTAITSGASSQNSILKVGGNSALASTTIVTLDSHGAASTAKLDLGNGTASFNPTVAGILTASTGTPRQGFSIITNSDTTAAFAHTGILTVNPTSADNFNGLIQDGTTSRVGLAVGGTNTLTLSSANAYTGGTTVSSGTLAVNANTGTTTNVLITATASGTTTQLATVSSTLGMAIGQTVTASNLAAGTYIVGINGNVLSLSAHATTANTSSGTFSAYQTLGSGAVTTSGTGTLDLSGSTNTSVGAVTVSGGTIQNGTLTGTSYTTSSGTVSANLAGSGIALTKSGAGKTTLSGTNAYTGATTISQGILAVNGSIALSSGVSVASGATLGGSGAVSAITGAGTVAPGNSPGILTATSATLGAGGESFKFELTATGNPTWGTAAASVNDVLHLTDASTPLVGTANSSNTFDIYLTGSNGLNNGILNGGDTYVGGIFTDKNSNFTSLLSSATFNYYVLDTTGSISYNGNLYDAYLGTVTASTLQIGSANFAGGTVSSGWSEEFTVAVPEPSTYAMLLGGVSVLIVLRRLGASKRKSDTQNKI